ncbi:hypothetical protein [Ferrovibrio sp.]|uniref:hypothetical protein n=1 Tax=Ferrovibrio sp. TaxID=1917215 RepID=UPI003D2CD345
MGLEINANLLVSGLALLVSITTAWLTLWRKGTVKMTRPTVIYFGRDGGPQEKRQILKVYLRSLLYSTAKRGAVIESMYIRLKRGETVQNFSIWVLGDDKLTRGSGLFLSESGVATNHHFLLPADAGGFQFLQGIYQIDVMALVVGEKQHRLLYSTTLDVSSEHSTAINNTLSGLYFDWGPDSQRYYSTLKLPNGAESPLVPS